MIRCQNCSAETSNGLALCELCQRYAGDCCEWLPVYFRNLARWRPGRAGARQVHGSRVLYDGSDRAGTGDRISDRLDETLTMLTTRARMLTDDRSLVRPLTLVDAVLSDDMAHDFAEALNDDSARAVALLCEGLEGHLTSIATTDWCGDLVRDLGEHEAKLRALTEVAVPGWYAGTCRHVVGRSMEGDLRCEAPTYVVPGLTWVRCGRCGTTTAARDHLEIVLTEARDWVARPKAIADAIVALVDTEPSVPRLYDRIRQWVHRGDLKPIRRTVRDYVWSEAEKRPVLVDVEAGRARYQLGEVLDLVLPATRSSAPTSENAAVAS